MPELGRKRPKYLNLIKIKLPIAGIASILHRVSGVGIFLMLPLLVWLFELSLRSPESFQELQAVITHPVLKLILIGLLWSLLHHFCMGIRILLIDMHMGVDKAQASASAKMVLAVSLPMTLILGAKLW
ncbi:MAG: succinate dehydrogenase, cytochrome b556 subunit [Gammaproteobacteria bacterium]|nr:succinate dehydrogenase, cytochrome b556 subunit [Rhodocyclaceae bacterium]MBU3907649.1 succinate dehydrogenase, cytochrome b556 subunit [Gammaproteobacteria bacterium]MBU3988393.1 succinate dehydrogenase, cytochrome b556 subunit [Gammaproteobacteria bacterium]MBU4004295.1 succinate dehydrogenase, cytochrome b556 subunit [Gammaproteobacteria bacterium]MBU4019704.1 succinate dehydrogenase, cytochrome b556 subunit [Gammaproteobacteria bacterium]